ncbi:MAG: hypothetical protein ACRD5R_13255 [Candidatus Acidiferrales bacterium]
MAKRAVENQREVAAIKILGFTRPNPPVDPKFTFKEHGSTACTRRMMGNRQTKARDLGFSFRAHNSLIINRDIFMDTGSGYARMLILRK